MITSDYLTCFSATFPGQCVNLRTVPIFCEASLFKEFAKNGVIVVKEPTHVIQTIYKARYICFLAKQRDFDQSVPVSFI